MSANSAFCCKGLPGTSYFSTLLPVRPSRTNSLSEVEQVNSGTAPETILDLLGVDLAAAGERPARLASGQRDSSRRGGERRSRSGLPARPRLVAQPADQSPRAVRRERAVKLAVDAVEMLR